jgi:hypothetical protein
MYIKETTDTLKSGSRSTIYTTIQCKRQKSFSLPPSRFYSISHIATAIPVIATVVSAISVHPVCKALFQSHLVVRHLVSRYVKADIRHNARMVLEVLIINAEAVGDRLQIGPVHSVWQTDVIQEHVVVL